MMSAPPVTIAVVRPWRIAPTLKASAATLDASRWLKVTFGPRSPNSIAHRLAGAFETVLLKRIAGTPVGPWLGQAVEVFDQAVEAGRVGPERDAHVVAPFSGRHQAGVVQQQTRASERDAAGGIDAPQLQRRNERGRIEAANGRAAMRSARRGVEPVDGRDAALAGSDRVDEGPIAQAE